RCGYQRECEEILPQLMRTLGHDSGHRSSRIFQVIGQKSLPALAQKRQSDNVIVRRNVTRALAFMTDDPKTRPLLLGQLADPDPQVGGIAVAAVLKGGAERDVIAAVLRTYNDDPDVTVQAAALEAFHTPLKILGDRKTALERIIKGTESHDQKELYFEA